MGKSFIGNISDLLSKVPFDEREVYKDFLISALSEKVAPDDRKSIISGLRAFIKVKSQINYKPPEGVV